MSVNGIIQFAKLWTKVYQAEINARAALDFEGSERAARVSPKSHYKTISSIETGFFFAAVARLVVNADGEVASAFLVNAELEEMQQDSLNGIELTSSERKTLKQRIQAQHLTIMSALNHFGLFEIVTRKGALSNDVNFYVITDKGRKSLSELESGA